jgi:exopolysaccharide/PEP-CTERM locus tyrosine autokinase
MTEQTKIPVPKANRPKKGESLLERASGAFALDGFAPAPMPKVLAQPPLKRGAKPVEAAPAVQPAPEPVVAPAAEVENLSSAWESIAPAPMPAVPAKPPLDASVAKPKAKAKAAPKVAAAPADLRPQPEAAIHFDTTVHPVDRRKLAEQGFIVPEGAVTALLEEFRIIKRAVLEAARKSDKAQRVLVCSPLPGEGKTFCATNLALAIAAEKDSDVLLVDADFAKPSVLSVLGLSGGKGLMDALVDPSVAIEDCVIKTDIAGFNVLPAGTSTSSDSEFLTSRRTAEVLDRLTQGAPDRLVIFDSPPALAASPAAELAKHVGQAVLVARADTTGRSAMEDALQLLGSCRDIKLLLNDSHFSPSGRRFGAYYGYGG